jgi:hypothetical protein
MRNVLWVLVAIGCGGSSKAPQPPVQPDGPTIQNTPPPATPTGLTKEVCAQRADDFGPVPLRAEQVALRRGTGAKRITDVPSTKDAPIEVCMPGGQREWLASVTCPDESKPTNAQRAGSVGPGGTCGSIIDRYVVTCPDKEYEVFMDMYMCPPGAGI